MLCSLSSLAFGLVLPTAHVATPLARVARAHVFALTPDDAIDAAAARVIFAAKQFGSAKEAAAIAWCNEAMSSEEVTRELVNKQLELFDECLLDDSAGKCKELDMSLGELEKAMNQKASAWSKFDRAAARLRKAAAHFGTEPTAAANLFISGARREGAINPALLLQVQDDLFGACLLDETGSSERCVELQDAITAVQASIGVRGQVVSTKGFMPSPVEDADEQEGGIAPTQGFTPSTLETNIDDGNSTETPQ